MPQISRRLLLAAGGAALLPAAPAIAAPASRLIDARWRTFGNDGDPDHGAWDALLGRHLKAGSDGIARFDYAAADQAQVGAYIASLTARDPATLNASAAF
ncbi:MAG: hypothetical protein AAFV27_02085, partial [Pseudomonadota bacterium]